MRAFLREYLPYYVVGVILGFTILSIFKQTELLEDLHMMAREQRRMWLARLQREYEASAAAANGPSKEPDNG